MKKSLCVLLTLLTLALAAFVWMHQEVGAAAGQVELCEVALFGDSSALPHTALKLRLTCDDHLFWNTEFHPGSAEKPRTSFAYSQSAIREERIYPATAQLYISGNFGISGKIDLMDTDSLETPLAPARDVASRTPAGETRTEHLRLIDYYDCFPLVFDMHIPGAKLRLTEETRRAVANYFRFPVPEDYTVQVSVRKDNEGNVVELEHNADFRQDGVVFALSAVAEERCFLTFTGDGGRTVDTRLLPGGNAIYELPIKKVEENGRDVLIPQPDQLRPVFPLGAQSTEIHSLQLSQDDETLLLLTREEGTLTLTVIDLEGMQLVQKLPLMQMDEDAYLGYLWDCDDFLLISVDDGSAALLERGEDGRYRAEFAVDLAYQEEFFYALRSDVALAYDGDTLLMAAYQTEPNNDCGFYLAAWNRGGMIYAGRYDNSLDVTRAGSERYRCQPVDNDALRIEFAEN